jgi:hypothetical protein
MGYAVTWLRSMCKETWQESSPQSEQESSPNAGITDEALGNNTVHQGVHSFFERARRLP